MGQNEGNGLETYLGRQGARVFVPSSGGDRRGTYIGRTLDPSAIVAFILSAGMGYARLGERRRVRGGDVDERGYGKTMMVARMENRVGVTGDFAFITLTDNKFGTQQTVKLGINLQRRRDILL